MVPSTRLKRGTKMGLIIAGVAGVILVVAIFVVVPKLVMKSIAPKLDARIAKVYPADKLLLKDLGALSFGLESKGVTQSRGNGGLVLTADTLHWFQFMPEIEVKIPLDSITTVDKVRSHLGKAQGVELLHVVFTVDGKPDSIAWRVGDVEAWVTQLARARGTAKDRMIK